MEPVARDGIAFGCVVVKRVLSVRPGTHFTARACGLGEGRLDGRVGDQRVGAALKDEDRGIDPVAAWVEAQPVEDAGQLMLILGAESGLELSAGVPERRQLGGGRGPVTTQAPTRSSRAARWAANSPPKLLPCTPMAAPSRRSASTASRKRAKPSATCSST